MAEVRISGFFLLMCFFDWPRQSARPPKTIVDVNRDPSPRMARTLFLCQRAEDDRRRQQGSEPSDGQNATLASILFFLLMCFFTGLGAAPGGGGPDFRIFFC